MGKALKACKDKTWDGRLGSNGVCSLSSGINNLTYSMSDKFFAWPMSSKLSDINFNLWTCKKNLLCLQYYRQPQLLRKYIKNISTNMLKYYLIEITGVVDKIFS